MARRGSCWNDHAPPVIFDGDEAYTRSVLMRLEVGTTSPHNAIPAFVAPILYIAWLRACVLGRPCMRACVCVVRECACVRACVHVRVCARVHL